MRFYPKGDPRFYWDISDGWNRCQYCPHKKWKLRQLKTGHFRYWQDLEGAKMKKITADDLMFDDWKCKNFRPEACLPILYAVGERYINLEKAEPNGFKCSPLPMGYIDAKKALENKKKPVEEANKAGEKGNAKGKGKGQGKGKGNANDKTKSPRKIGGQAGDDDEDEDDDSPFARVAQRQEDALNKYLERLLKCLKNKAKLPPFVPGLITGPNLPYLDCRVGAGITPPPKCCAKDPCNITCYC